VSSESNSTSDAGRGSSAPVVGADEIRIAAPPETVWDVLAAIEDWPSWNPDVKSVSIAGAVAPGTEFRWKSGPGTITSTLQEVERPRLIAWTGRTFGLRAFHVWRFEPEDGGTRVQTEESFDGTVARLFRRPLRRTLTSALDSGLRHLKAEAERRVRA
jgi:uncharacterized protein YndB with AHSA1/START domain